MTDEVTKRPGGQKKPVRTPRVKPDAVRGRKPSKDSQKVRPRSVRRPVAVRSVRTMDRKGTVSKKKAVRSVARPRVRPKRVSKRPVEEKEPAPSTDLGWMEEDPKDHLLSRFIYDPSNNVIGESIGVEGKHLIMKSGLKFYSIPLTNIVEKDDNLALKGRIDRKKARKLGEAWRKRALDPLYQKKNKK